MNGKVKALVAVIGLLAIGLIVMIVFALQAKAPTKDSAPAQTTKQGTNTVDQGTLQSTDEVVGTGAEAKLDSTITVKYTGTLADGTVFDSTDKHGGTPATFQLSKGSLIDGWVQGIPGMKVGGKRKLVIPPALAYGDQGTNGIPPNSTLTFEIELLDVK